MRAAIIILLLSVTLGIYAQEEKIKGLYITEGGEAKVKIFKATNGKYYGKFVWYENEDSKDVKNPDPTLRDRTIKNMIFMKDFSYDPDKKQWKDGKIYNTENGKMYECYLWFEDDMDKLYLRGYIMGLKMLGGTSVWTRIHE